ncbi:nicotinamide mononucleotide transporter [Plantactinospora sp. S1510]|uniref:Nicotinamide mononucleotide transporter n=1 Tax=Plantactinospora alkalitolerans TaxID=2789879 RepID=A0ABS0H7D9_9ACTN|nr:nicotinamide riboside transporter PnuC [Plantactinospora alkalitolerans]MBF9134022.1 nicotinamide mononucleotide transporter [Plantactinospora alkalitolerans]
MLDWLTGTAFTVADTPTSRAELLGFATGVLNVWLLARQRMWNWPIGIANVLLLMLLFWTAGLYADAGLQVVYVALGLYGWWAWLFGGAERSRLVVSRTGAREWMALAGSGVLLTLVLWLLLDRATDSTVPLPDAVTTALSLMATYGQCRKRVESWWIWIAADLIYIPLYVYKGLHLTAGLYLVFLGLCVFGLRNWQADLRRPAAARPAAPGPAPATT